MIIIKSSTKQRFIVAFLLLGDIIVFLLGYSLSQFIVSGKIKIGLHNWTNAVFPFIMIFFFFLMYDLYSPYTDKVFESALSAALSVFIASVLSITIVYLMKFQTVSVVVWFLRLIIMAIVMVIWRTVAALFLKKFGRKRKCLIIENKNNTSRLARKLKYASNYGREATYYMIDEDNEEEINILLNEKLELFDQIYILPAISRETGTNIATKARNLKKDIVVLVDLDRITTMRGTIFQLDDTPVVEKKELHMSKMQRFVKRSFDIAFSLILCVITMPVAILCAALIHLDSEGPVFYKQERYTRDKKKFNVFKFRTMIQDAEEYGAQLATEDDPRITKVGKFLRATRLDELPQLYNILLGTMSVVGPRPERPVFADEFSENVKNYDMRYCVKAGLTGYAQVYGKYNTRVSDKILMDMIYVVNYSFLLDIKLILLTIKTMFVKSATEGLDEERDAELSSEENERKRREETLRQLGLQGVKNENIRSNSGI